MTHLRNPRLSPSELGIEETQANFTSPFKSTISNDDAVLSKVRSVLEDGYAGVIFVGPPGTSKSWYAREIASVLSGGQEDAVVFVQFHPSYQYEDFIEGWVPNEKGGFVKQPKAFLSLCEQAKSAPSQAHFLVIDELSRTDAARVFGEALTYLETSKRDIPFFLSSGTKALIPPNVVVLATMNPWDRGVDEVDAALLRRFAQIEMLPREDLLRTILQRNGIKDNLIDGVSKFFLAIQSMPNPMLRIGHAYFNHSTSADGLERLWEHQLRPHFKSVCRLEPDTLKRIEGMWSNMVSRIHVETQEEIIEVPAGKDVTPNG